ncbi:MAG: GNAT family N-acetyltransferase [Formosimonas sp.]
MEKIIVADLFNPQHSAAVVQLLNEYALDPMGGGVELTAYVKENLVAKLRKRQGVHVILAFVDEQPVGLINAFEGFSTFACQSLLNIHDVVVSSAFRGQGVAQKMLNKAEELAQNLGCCKITLEVLASNHKAQASYHTSGYADTGMQFWQKKL